MPTTFFYLNKVNVYRMEFWFSVVRQLSQAD